MPGRGDATSWLMRFARNCKKGAVQLRGMEAYDALLDSLEQTAASGKIVFLVTWDLRHIQFHGHCQIVAAGVQAD